MNVRLQFEGIRCFSTPQDVPFRPLTLLVGENSSGKTTLLALCRLAYAIVRQRLRHIPFNEPPFLLGAYEQIASNRGQSGPVKSFYLTTVLDAYSLRAEFISRKGQPSVDLLRLTSGNAYFELPVQPDERVVTLHGSRGEQQLKADPDIQIPDEPAFMLMSMKNPAIHFRKWLWSGKDVFSDTDLESLETARQTFQSEFGHHPPLAFAPIRSSPRRTYDPVEFAEEPEGSHMPMMLAALARSSEHKLWANVQSKLSEFGSKSGLFDGIEVVNKGEKESDPFQVGIKRGGRVFNLIDVGYGVSQALPILVDVFLRQAPFQVFLIQQPEVHLHPRAQAELGSFFASQTRGRRRFVIETHSDHLVDRIRMEIRKETLKPEDVALLYFERVKHGAVIHTIELDRDGSITNPPPGYREFFLKEELSLLGV